MDKCKQLLIKLLTPVGTNKFCHKKKENYTLYTMSNMLHSKRYWYIVHVDSFYLVVTLVQKPQQWQTQNVIKSMRRQKKWFICVKRQWPWLKVGHSDRCHIFALDIEIIEYNGNYFVFNDCLMWLVVLITTAYDLWNMHNYAVVLFSVFGLWLAPSTRTHAIEKKATKQENFENSF